MDWFFGQNLEGHENVHRLSQSNPSLLQTLFVVVALVIAVMLNSFYEN